MSWWCCLYIPLPSDWLAIAPGIHPVCDCWALPEWLVQFCLCELLVDCWSMECFPDRSLCLMNDCCSLNAMVLIVVGWRWIWGGICLWVARYNALSWRAVLDPGQLWTKRVSWDDRSWKIRHSGGWWLGWRSLRAFSVKSTVLVQDKQTPFSLTELGIYGLDVRSIHAKTSAYECVCRLTYELGNKYTNSNEKLNIECLTMDKIGCLMFKVIITYNIDKKYQ